MLPKPISRKSNIVESELEKELLIYDLMMNKAFCLNQTSGLVYQLADGTKTVTEISKAMSMKLKTKVSEDLVWLALDELKKNNLLEIANEVTDHFAGQTRREAIKRVGLASMVMLPAILSLSAPNAAMAASCAANGAFCTPSNNTQGNCCNSNQRCFTTNAANSTCMNCYPATTRLSSCQGSAGCCNQRSDRALCCSGTYTNNPVLIGVDYQCDCA